MPLYTVGDCLPLIGRKLDGSGVNVSCEPGFSKALAAYNKINRLLMLEKETVAEAFVQLPVTGGTLTLDRQVKRILEAKEGCSTIPVVGRQQMFLDGVDWERSEGCGCMERLVFAGNRFPTHRDLDRPRLIFAISDRPEADGLKLTLIGKDRLGAELRTMGAGKGITVPITYAACDEPPRFNCGDGYHRGEVSCIHAVLKPRTNGYVQLWGLDERNGDVFWITTMAPDETSPSLTRYRVLGPACASINAHVSLQYVPLYDVNEVSLIQQPDAYEDMAQALHFKDTGDYGGFQTFRNSALSLVSKERKQSDGTRHALNVTNRSTGIRGRTFSHRPR